MAADDDIKPSPSPFDEDFAKKMEDRAVDAIKKTWEPVFKEAHDQYEEDTKAAMEVIRKHKKDFDAKKERFMNTMIQVEGEHRAKRVASGLQAYMSEEMAFGEANKNLPIRNAAGAPGSQTDIVNTSTGAGTTAQTQKQSNQTATEAAAPAIANTASSTHIPQEDVEMTDEAFTSTTSDVPSSGQPIQKPVEANKDITRDALSSAADTYTVPTIASSDPSSMKQVKTGGEASTSTSTKSVSSQPTPQTARPFPATVEDARPTPGPQTNVEPPRAPLASQATAFAHALREQPADNQDTASAETRRHWAHGGTTKDAAPVRRGSPQPDSAHPRKRQKQRNDGADQIKQSVEQDVAATPGQNNRVAALNPVAATPGNPASNKPTGGASRQTPTNAAASSKAPASTNDTIVAKAAVPARQIKQEPIAQGPVRGLQATQSVPSNPFQLPPVVPVNNKRPAAYDLTRDVTPAPATPTRRFRLGSPTPPKVKWQDVRGAEFVFDPALGEDHLTVPRGHDPNWFVLRCTGPNGEVLKAFEQHPMIYDPKLGMSTALAHFNFDNTCPGHKSGGIYNHDTILKQFKHRVVIQSGQPMHETPVRVKTCNDSIPGNRVIEEEPIAPGGNGQRRNRHGRGRG